LRLLLNTRGGGWERIDRHHNQASRLRQLNAAISA
jgi:hypothetical protein